MRSEKGGPEMVSGDRSSVLDVATSSGVRRVGRSKVSDSAASERSTRGRSTYTRSKLSRAIQCSQKRRVFLPMRNGRRASSRSHAPSAAPLLLPLSSPAAGVAVCPVPPGAPSAPPETPMPIPLPAIWSSTARRPEAVAVPCERKTTRESQAMMCRSASDCAG